MDRGARLDAGRNGRPLIATHRALATPSGDKMPYPCTHLPVAFVVSHGQSLRETERR